jgi:hypothetical protein
MPTSHPLRPSEVPGLLRDLTQTTLNWVADYWLQIAISAAAASAIIFVLFALRRWGRYNYDPLVGPASMRAVIAQVVMRTKTFFIVILAIRVVSKYAQMPDSLEHWMYVFFAIAAVIQGAIWTRELVLGMIEHRTSAKNFQGETILNAMGLIRIMVSFTDLCHRGGGLAGQYRGQCHGHGRGSGRWRYRHRSGGAGYLW